MLERIVNYIHWKDCKISVMNKQIFEALIEAGASEEKAGNAAESVADYQKDMNQIKEKLALLQWGVGLIVVAEVIPLLKALFS